METCKYRPVERLGLYIMVFLILMGSCDIQDRQTAILRKLTKIEKALDSPKQSGGVRPEKIGE